MPMAVEKSQNRTIRENRAAESVHALAANDGLPGLRGTALPILDCPDSNVLSALWLFGRILGGGDGQKNGPVMTAHADMTADESEQE
jgi:hypothetical protein